MVHPCSVALWPMVTSEPAGSGTPGSACNTHPSCTLLPSPTTMVSRSARSAAPYQTLASAPIVARPRSTAPGATKAVPETSGRSWPGASNGGRPVPGRCAGWLLTGWAGRSRAARSRRRRMPSRNGRRSPHIYPPLVTGSPATIRCASPSLAASKIAMPVLTWPRHGPAAISRPSASSLRSQAAGSVPLMVAMKSSRGGCMKKDPVAHAPILPLLRALGCHGVGCEKGHRARRQPSAATAGGAQSASRSAVRARTHARGASPRRWQVHGDAQNGHSRVPPDYHWSAWMPG